MISKELKENETQTAVLEGKLIKDHLRWVDRMRLDSTYLRDWVCDRIADYPDGTMVEIRVSFTKGES